MAREALSPAANMPKADRRSAVPTAPAGRQAGHKVRAHVRAGRQGGRLRGGAHHDCRQPARAGGAGLTPNDPGGVLPRDLLFAIFYIFGRRQMRDLVRAYVNSQLCPACIQDSVAWRLLPAELAGLEPSPLTVTAALKEDEADLAGQLLYNPPPRHVGGGPAGRRRTPDDGQLWHPLAKWCRPFGWCRNPVARAQ